MSLTSQPAAYKDCYALFELAIRTPGGVRAPVGTAAQAQTFQMRMNMARKLQRDMSRRIYAPDSHLYDTSEFDSYQVTIAEADDGEFWVYVRPHGRLDVIAAAEPISYTEPEVLQLEHYKEPSLNADEQQSDLE
ncbi:MAG: hypothetical protein P4L50_00150 [Anaerolineaceae bacterium]|nr:hypothetical protein [Anaerolineaceae bacterium]